MLNGKYSIYLFNGELPKTTRLSEVEDYIFREYNSENIAVSGDNIIFVNKGKDLQKLLYGLVTEDKISSEELLLLYQTKGELSGGGEVEELKSKVQRLEAIIENLTKVSGRDQNDITTRIDEYTNEIKERSERYLFHYLKDRFPKQNVVWLNADENEDFVESWRNHDFEVREILPFHWTANG